MTERTKLPMLGEEESEKRNCAAIQLASANNPTTRKGRMPWFVKMLLRYGGVLNAVSTKMQCAIPTPPQSSFYCLLALNDWSCGTETVTEMRDEFPASSVQLTTNV